MRRLIFRLFPMLPFLSYLRPYRLKIVLAMVCLVFVGLLEPFSILMLKPGLDVIFQRRDGEAEVSAPAGLDVLGGFAATGQPAGEEGSAGTDSLAGVSAEAEGTADKSGRVASEATAGKAGEAESGAASADAKAPKRTVPNPLKSVQAKLKTWTSESFGPLKTWYQGLAQDRPFMALLAIAGVLVVATIFRGGFEYASNYLLMYSMQRVTIDLQVEIFRRVLSQDYLFFKEKTTGYLISRIGSDVQLIRNTTMNLIRDGLQQPLTLFFLLIVLIYLSPTMTLLAMVVLPIAGVILYRFAHKMRRITKKSRKKGDELSSMLEEALRNYPVVKTFGTEEREIERFAQQSEQIFKLSMKGRSIRFGTGPLMEALGAVSLGGILLLGGYMVLVRGSLDPSGFIVYLLALTRFYGPIKRLARLNLGFQEAVISAERLEEMLSMRPRIASPGEAAEPAEFQKEIRLDHITFGYDEREPVLQDVSLEIKKGKMLALVGPSGAGKTTLVGLLPRLFDPQKGRVTLDGVDLRQIDLGRLRRLFGVVTQETVLFNDTVVNNIAYGSRHVDRARAEECARAANAHDFILDLEKGYDTIIGQAGTRLSGGQAQRLAIARALYRDPPILLLDEATSHLDARSEALVQEAIDRLLEGRTAVVIAHRLSTVRRADVIVVLERGRVVELGTHRELLAQVELYKNLYALQTSE